ncbi:MAG: DNA polymerase III subunit delta [Candidatus Peribacteraceae bacterium]|nr:DNA polymerase III subunit delta [Candidatus Peribacteraceae bacterium]
MPPARSKVPNLHFFTGENDFALRRELKRWKSAFLEKYGEENFLEISGRETLSRLLDAAATMPFLGEKRLVIIDGLPPLSREEFKSLTGNIHPQVVVAIVEPKPDKRLGVVKDIESCADVKRYPALSEHEIDQWIRKEAAKLHASIDDAAVRNLLQTVGTDQWMLLGELQKLVLFSDASIRSPDVDALSLPSGDQIIWRFTDLIGGRQPYEAIRFFHHRLDRGEDAYQFWGILLNALKNLALVWSSLQEGRQDERTIATAFAVSPYAIRGLVPLARSLSAHCLRRIIDTAAEADLALKSGGHHYSADRQEEVVALIERVILLCG